MSKFMTISDVARELHISLGTARNRISKNELMPPSIRVGRKRLFPTTEFEKWVNELTKNISGPDLPKKDKSSHGRPRISKRGTRGKYSREK